VLACPSLGDDPLLAEPHSKQRLPKRVVDLVSAAASTRVQDIVVARKDRSTIPNISRYERLKKAL
jgi:hypothetical protein